LLAGLPFAILSSRRIPFQRGVFCSDESIRYPYKEDTISYKLLAGILIPFSIIVICLAGIPEWSHHLIFTPFLKDTSHTCIQSPTHLIIHMSQAFLCHMGPSGSVSNLSGVTFCTLLEEELSFCKRQISITVDWMLQKKNNKMFALFSSRLSFYSGHSSFSMYCMLFLAVSTLIPSKWVNDLVQKLQHLLGFLILSLAETRHHWSDVLTGLIQGAVVAMLIVVYVSDFFKVRGCTFQPKEDSHTTLHETPTNGNHFGSNHQP
ncbi:PLPP1 phosphatase, partial [Eolophus roseicapillus]|nr:PLPP1 phosphatase [Eolophus roseicapilla]